MKRAHRIKTTSIEYLLPGIPRGMIVVISGRPGDGKSTLTALIAALVSKNAPVIFSNHEDPHESVVKPRLEAAGADLRRIFVPEEPFLLPQDVAELERRVRQTGTVLIVADAAAQHFGVSSTSGHQIRKALTPLKRMLERTGCTCIFVDHLVKRPSKTSNPLEALAGAGSGLPAAARFVYVFGRNPNDPDERILAPVKVNAADVEHSLAYAMEGAAVIDSDGHPVEVGKLTLINDACDVDASQVIAFNGGGKAADGAAGVKGAIAQEFLIGLLMFGTKKAKEIENEGKTAGFSFRTLQRAADKIGVIRKRIGFGTDSHVEWRLPDDHPALKVAKAMGKAAPSKTTRKKVA